VTLQLTCHRPDPGGPRRPRPGWLPGSAAASLIRREWLAVLCGVSALFATVTAVVSAHPAQRAWGMFAAGGYCAAGLAALAGPRLHRAGPARHQGTDGGARRRGNRLAVLAALGGAVFAPLAWLATAGRAQPEVGVIVRSATLFLHRGTPYVSAAALASAHSPNAYDPYLPALIVFGMPRALLGGGLLTDPRVWFGAVFAVTFGAALAIAGTPRPGWWVAAVTASPVIAFPLSVGGDDLPVLSLLCLGLVVAASGHERSWRRPVAAGLILGLAAAMKATAWPALAVALVLIGARQGRRAAAVFGLAAAGVALFADGPALAVAPGAMVANTIEFPLGMAKVASPAASALPGHLIAAALPDGRWVAVALVVIAGLAVGVSLLVNPPKDAQAAGWRLVIGLTLMFLLAPASRAGYFVYPLGLSAWLLLTRPRGPGGLGGLGWLGWLGWLGGRLGRTRRPEQQVVDDPVPPQQFHLPQQDAGGGAVPEGRRR
jgi:Glycosyltransferase family 87